MNGEDSSCGNRWKCLSGTSFEQTCSQREGGHSSGDLGERRSGQGGEAALRAWGRPTAAHSAELLLEPPRGAASVKWGQVVLVITGHPRAGCINSW